MNVSFFDSKGTPFTPELELAINQTVYTPVWPPSRPIEELPGYEEFLAHAQTRPEAMLQPEAQVESRSELVQSINEEFLHKKKRSNNQKKRQWRNKRWPKKK